MTTALTPYDTGKRLQPMPWHVQPLNLPDPAEEDQYGRVDFDDDEGATILTGWVEKTEAGYVLNLVSFQDDVTIKVQTP